MTINEFIEELKKIGISIDNDKLNKLEKYYELLINYNEKMNLTGITKKEEVYLKHFFDSLTLCRVIDMNKYNTLCDVGTGAGFPGLVLKIVFPHLKITLIDSLNKRIKFLNEVINLLNLKDIETINARIEEYAIMNREKYDIVTSRAVAPLNILSEYCLPIVKINGYFIAMKGSATEELNNSLEAIKKLSGKLVLNDTFLLPFEQSNRSIIKIEKMKPTNIKYPRRYTEIKNKPL